jgi:hypothetical protein
MKLPAGKRWNGNFVEAVGLIAAAKEYDCAPGSLAATELEAAITHLKAAQRALWEERT